MVVRLWQNCVSPICLITSQVWLQTELDDMKFCYQLILTITDILGFLE